MKSLGLLSWPLSGCLLDPEAGKMRGVQLGAKWMGEPLEVDASVPILSFSYYSFLSNTSSVTEAYSPDEFDLNVNWHSFTCWRPGFPACSTSDRWLEHKGNNFMNGWRCWWYLNGLSRSRSWFEEGGHWNIRLKGISYLPMSPCFPPWHTHILFSLPFPFPFSIPSWGENISPPCLSSMMFSALTQKHPKSNGTS